MALLGRFKGEDGDRTHVFPLANVTSSGIQIRIWLERVVQLLDEEAKESCPAFCDMEGYQLRETEVEEVFHPILELIQDDENYAGLLTRGLDVRENYRCARSFRRGAENTALINGVDKEAIKFVHRWGRYETNRGAQPGFNMIEH